MKKVIALLLAIVMVMSLAACGSSAEPAAEQAAETTWADELGTAGLLRVGIAADYPPYESYDAAGNVVGLDADIAQLIADKLGVELELVPMSFDTIVSAVAAGTVDMGISCFSYTEERAKSVLFSNTYMTSAQACFTSTAYGVDTMEALKDGVVCAGNGTTGMDVAESLKDQYGFTTQAGEIAVITEAIRSGAVKGCITELCVAQSVSEANPGEFQIIADDLSVEEIKAVANLNSVKLIEEVNKIIDEFTASPDYSALVVKWFG